MDVKVISQCTLMGGDPLRPLWVKWHCNCVVRPLRQSGSRAWLSCLLRTWFTTVTFTLEAPTVLLLLSGPQSFQSTYDVISLCHRYTWKLWHLSTTDQSRKFSGLMEVDWFCGIALSWDVLHCSSDCKAAVHHVIISVLETALAPVLLVCIENITPA